MSWSALPDDVKLDIVRYLDREDCKNLRLTSKADSRVATSRVFRIVHLAPNSRTFERARAIAASQELSSLVKSVVFHVGILSALYDFPEFEKRLKTPKKSSISEDELTDDVLRSKYKCYLEELENQKRFFETVDEAGELKELCRHFEALNSISTLPEESFAHDPPISHITRTTGLRSDVPAEGLHISSLFSAVETRSLTSIRALSMSWGDLSRIATDSLARIDLKNLNTLAIALDNESYLETRAERAPIENLDALLRASITSHDFTLELDFMLLGFRFAREELQLISKTIFQHRWSKLKSLALYGICAMQDDLTGFLGKHGTTLRSLSLGDITLLTDPIISQEPWENEEEGREVGSVIELFRWINENLELESASISKGFTNCFFETWSVEDDEVSKGIRLDIELWLTRKASSPVPSELLRPRDGKVLSEEVAEKWSDDSWEWDFIVAVL